jgi:hypothetical protein
VNATGTSVTLGWQPGFDGGAPVTFRVQFNEMGSTSTTEKTITPSNATTYTITGLRPHIRYLFYVGAVNKYGHSGYPSTAGLVHTMTGR